MIVPSYFPSRTQDQVLDFFRKDLNIEVPSLDVDLFEGGIIDSLAFVNLLVYLEQTFEINVSLDDLEIDDFRSIARIAELVDARLMARQGNERNGTRASVSTADSEAV
jgi:methoxymalonate biosynthesis acyl carrier protein